MFVVSSIPKDIHASQSKLNESGMARSNVRVLSATRQSCNHDAGFVATRAVFDALAERDLSALEVSNG